MIVPIKLCYKEKEQTTEDISHGGRITSQIHSQVEENNHNASGRPANVVARNMKSFSPLLTYETAWAAKWPLVVILIVHIKM